MKNMLLKLSRYVLGVLGIACVSACDNGEDDDFGGTLCMYGTPTADFVVKGKVLDMTDNPIKGIAVTLPDTYCDTVYTKEDGSYELEWEGFPSDTADLKFTDVDDEANGGRFESLVKSVELERQKKGSGWYEGLYAAFGVDVNLYEEMVCEYGTPYATFEVKGKVVNSDGEPINGIAVYADEMYGQEETVYTEADGSFSLKQEWWFPNTHVDLVFEDQDGEDNGGDFGKKEESVALVKTQDGEGWYEGVFSSEEDITVVM